MGISAEPGLNEQRKKIRVKSLGASQNDQVLICHLSGRRLSQLTPPPALFLTIELSVSLLLRMCDCHGDEVEKNLRPMGNPYPGEV